MMKPAPGTFAAECAALADAAHDLCDVLIESLGLPQVVAWLKKVLSR